VRRALDPLKLLEIRAVHTAMRPDAEIKQLNLDRRPIHEG
jgi:hypothetical protein